VARAGAPFDPVLLLLAALGLIGPGLRRSLDRRPVAG